MTHEKTLQWESEKIQAITRSAAKLSTPLIEPRLRYRDKGRPNYYMFLHCRALSRACAATVHPYLTLNSLLDCINSLCTVLLWSTVIGSERNREMGVEE